MILVSFPFGCTTNLQCTSLRYLTQNSLVSLDFLETCHHQIFLKWYAEKSALQNNKQGHKNHSSATFDLPEKLIELHFFQEMTATIYSAYVFTDKTLFMKCFLCIYKKFIKQNGM